MKKLLSTLVLLFVCAFFACAQSPFELTDSIVIAGHSDFYVKLFDDTIHIVEWNDGKITRYDMMGAFIDSVRIGGRFNKNVPYHQNINGIDKAKAGYVVYSDNGQSVHTLTASGKLLQSKRLKAHYKGQRYFVASNQWFDVLRYVPELDGYLIPIEAVARREKGQAAFGPKENSGYKSFYQTKGLVGLFNKKGQLKMVYGDWPDIYLKNEFLTYYTQIKFQYKNGLIYIGTGASSTIQIWSLSGDKLDEFTPHFTPLDTVKSLPGIASLSDSKRYKYHYMIETPSAEAFQFGPSSDFMIRNFRPAAIDTCLLGESFLQRFQEYDSLRQTTGVCPLPPREIDDQIAQWIAKPWVAVFYTISSDGVVSEGTIIETNDGKAFHPIGFLSNGFALRRERYDVEGKRFVVGVYGVVVD